MKATIDVENRAEGDRIRTALTDPQTRALVNVVGALLPLRESARARVLRWALDKFVDDKAEQAAQGGIVDAIRDY